MDLTQQEINRKLLHLLSGILIPASIFYIPLLNLGSKMFIVILLAGIKMGRIKIWNKTLEGSLACFMVCILFSFLLFPKIPMLLEPWGGKMPFFIGITASLSTTILELVPIKIFRNIYLNDNLSVPIFTGLIIKIVNWFLAINVLS